MEYIDYISTEGGPLIISDFNTILLWSGIDNDDYENLCDIFNADPSIEGVNFSIGGNNAVAWELEGGGVAKIYKDSEKILIVKSWLPEENIETIEFQLANSPLSEKHIFIGDLTNNSGVIAIFWAPESGNNAKFDANLLAGRPKGDFAMDDAVFYFKNSIKKMTCIHDEIDLDYAKARRLHLFFE